MTKLENIPFAELTVGMSRAYTRTITEEDIRAFATLSGDHNPVHLDPEYAKTTQFGGCIAHGAFCGMMISAAVATELPGPGSIYLGQEMRFKHPVRPGDTLTTHLTVAEKKQRGNIVLIDNEIVNQHGEIVFTGQSKVMASDEKVCVEVEPDHFAK